MISFLKKILPFGVVLLLWEMLCAFTWVDPTFFPPPHKIVYHTVIMLLDPEFYLLGNLLQSMKRLIVAAVIAIPLGIFIALSVFSNKMIRATVQPWLAAIFPVPKIGMYPVILLIFGIGDMSQIFVISLGIFFLVNFNSLMGFRHLEARGYLFVTKIYKFSFFSTCGHVLIRGSYSEILEGIKLGMVHGLLMVVASEFTVSSNGIGFVMWNAWDHFRILDVYACLLLISLHGTFIFYSIERIKLRLVRKYHG